MAKITVDAQTQILTRDIVTFRQVGSLYRRDSETHRLALVEPEDVMRSLRTRSASRQNSRQGTATTPCRPA